MNVSIALQAARKLSIDVGNFGFRLALLEAERDEIRETAMLLQPDTWRRRFQTGVIEDDETGTHSDVEPQVTITGDQMMLLDRLIGLIHSME